MTKKIFATFFLLLLAQVATAKPLYIAAAADLTYCLTELNAAFKSTHPDVDFKVSMGSSGNFFAQITAGAPFEVFMSADLEYPRQLMEAGLADKTSLTPYAIGQIALWTLDSGLDISKGLGVLTSSAVQRIAIANPKHAPYGRAARAAMEHSAVWDAVRSKIVMGENIGQAAQFVQSGNAEVGIVALSLLKSPNLPNPGKYYLIPQNSFPRMNQAAVLTKKGESNPVAREYMQFLRSAEARAIFDKNGFLLPN
jgi:molybdate transport system substrate-binding protein